jgi:TusA-related sulfurtransferase
MTDAKYPDDDFIKECIMDIFFSHDKLDDAELDSTIELHISGHGWDNDVKKWAKEEMYNHYLDLQKIFDDYRSIAWEI